MDLKKALIRHEYHTDLELLELSYEGDTGPPG